MSQLADRVAAILFDFDGVILDTVGPKTAAFRSIIAERIPEHVEPAMDYFDRNGGVSRIDKFEYIWRHIVGSPITRTEAEELGADFARRVREVVLTCAFIPGAEEFLQQHCQTLPCFVISGTPQIEMRDLTSTRGIDHYFRGIYGSPTKKAPHGEQIIAEHGYDRSKVWFIGDATTDRDAARDLGVKFIGIDGPHLTPFLDGDEIVVKDLCELEEILRQ